MVQKPREFSLLDIRGDFTNFIEIRQELDGSGNALYIGYSYKPNASTSEEVWFIVKRTFTGTSLTRQQLPDTGLKFNLAWDDRATYFE
jgi:hypothetical protein